MTAPLIRGWCPGARRPMMSGDGLVLRLRPKLGELTPAQATALADLAQMHGNGLIELTSRANLQLRGLSQSAHALLIDALAGLDLLDADAGAEARRNIVLDPFRPVGTDDIQHRIAAGLMQGLALPEFATLPSKFGFVVDAGLPRQLAGISGDIRIESSSAGLILRADGCPSGRPVPDAETAVGLALDLARWFIASGGVGSDGRGRMARHLAQGARLPAGLDGMQSPHAAVTAAPGPCAGGLCLGVGFGLLPAQALRQLATSGAPVLRITPWRMIFLPGVTDTSIPDGMIPDPLDPLLRVQACTGSPGCPQARIETLELARGLAASLPSRARLHVSGCAKGCAHPGPADFTLLGGPGGYDLIRNGTAWDQPMHRALSLTQIHEILGG